MCGQGRSALGQYSIVSRQPVLPSLSCTGVLTIGAQLRSTHRSASHVAMVMLSDTCSV